MNRVANAELKNRLRNDVARQLTPEPREIDIAGFLRLGALWQGFTSGGVGREVE